MTKCEECKNHKQITDKEFNKMPYDEQRCMDCKTLVGDGQCDCYSKEHNL